MFVSNKTNRSFTITSNVPVVDMFELSQDMLTNHRQEIVETLNAANPDIDVETYEDGIDSWFNGGSAAIHELGFKYVFSLKDDGSILTITY